MRSPKTSNPQFTIITATYDKRGDSLRRATESVSMQTFQDYEHIICFQDYAYAKVAQNKVRDVVVKNTTDYGNVQKQVGINQARGKYLLFLDDDNILFKDALQSINVFAMRNCDVIYSPIVYNDVMYFGTDCFEKGRIDLLQWCIKSEIAKKIPFPREGYESDWMYFNALNELKLSIVHNNEAIGVHAHPLEAEQISDIPGWAYPEIVYGFVAQYIPKNGICAELNAYLGKSSMYWDQYIRDYDCRITVIDEWTIVDGDKVSIETRYLYDQCMYNVTKFSDRHRVKLYQGSSVDAAKTIPNNTLALLSIGLVNDVEELVQIFKDWIDKVIPGGTIVGMISDNTVLEDPTFVDLLKSAKWMENCWIIIK